MKRIFTVPTGMLALILVASLFAPARSLAQATPTPEACDPNLACFIFTPADASGPSAVDLYIDSKLTASNVQLSNSTALISVAAGAHWLQMPSAGEAASTAKVTASYTFEAGTVSDLLLVHGKDAPTLAAFKIDPTAPAPGESRSRIINLWPGLGTVDVELGEPGDKTGGALNVSFASIAQDAASTYAETGDFSDLAAVNIFPAGSADLKAAPLLRACPANSICSYVLIGPAGKNGTVQYALSVLPA